MITKKVISLDEVKAFFDSSFNKFDETIGIVNIDSFKNEISLDKVSLDIIYNEKLFANEVYPLDSKFLSAKFKSLIRDNIVDKKLPENFYHIFECDNKLVNFKVEQLSDVTYKVYIIDMSKMLETEKEMTKLNNIIKSGESIYTVCTWWIDYDQYGDHFYQTPSGPSLLGLDVNENDLYNTKDFSIIREKASIQNEFYEECIQYEAKMYEKVRNNKSDYFGGRTPAVTKDDKEIWVESYGKCLIRYKDGRPRFFVAVDIYLSDLLENSNQLSMINSLIDQGLNNADVGIWYYQKYHQQGRYYFTESWRNLMGFDMETPNNEVGQKYNERIDSIVPELRDDLVPSLRKHSQLVHDAFENKIDSYKIVIPNMMDGYSNSKWIEVRGTVVERNADSTVKLFIGVNVDVTETVARNKELEKLRRENERLYLAEKLAIKAGSVLVWYQEFNTNDDSTKIYGNEMFYTKLGLQRDENGMIEMESLIQSIADKSDEELQYKNMFLEKLADLYEGKIDSFKDLMVKHIDTSNNELYFEHTVEVEQRFENGKVKIVGGLLQDVTKRVIKQEEVTYLANFDVLTGLNNRNYFEQFIKTGQLPNTYSVLLFDLDGLKLVNDAFGHIEGDKLIQLVAGYIKDIFSDHLLISRIGGDEFVVITSDVNEESLTRNANSLESKIDNYNLSSFVELNVSKGGKVVINNEIAFERAFTQAENLMYRRKLGNRSSRKSKVLESILETLNAKTEETKEHSERLTQYTDGIMNEMHMTRASEVEDMRLLARVHDIGKITIPDNILFKAGKLDYDEYEIIKKHSEAGYKIIQNITDSDFVSEAVLSHHERWDGQGYPQGLKGEEIPLFARIICVADAYDAMTSDRVYQKAKTKEEAIVELQSCSGTQFDPTVVKAFIIYLNK